MTEYIDSIIVALYFLIIFIVGFFVSRHYRKTSPEDFITGGRSRTWYQIGIALFAMGADPSVMGVAGLGFAPRAAGGLDDEIAVAADRDIRVVVAGAQTALLGDALVFLDFYAAEVGLLEEGFAEDAREMGIVALVAAGVDVGHIAADGLEGVCLAHHGEGAGYERSD